jgi:MFS family permease
VNLLPVLYVVTSFAYLMLAFPLGYVADRLGRPAVFAAGHGALLIAYVAAGTPLVGGVAFWVTPIMLGVYYGATDGVIAAITSARVQPSLRGSGLALMGSVIGLSRAASSLAFGWAWVHYGHREAIVAFGALLVCVAAPAGYALIRLDENR